jgi:hypothetical protein
MSSLPSAVKSPTYVCTQYVMPSPTYAGNNSTQNKSGGPEFERLLTDRYRLQAL